MEKHHRVEQATDDCITCTMHAGPKVTNTHSEYVILITFLQVAARIHLNVALYALCLSC